MDALGRSIAAIVQRRLEEVRTEKTTLRMSNLGKPDRQLWYDVHGSGAKRSESFSASTLTKFLFGDILEQLLLFFAVEAGHTVTDQQREVEVDGVVGHIDCQIDGVTVDVKSASTYSFKKFRTGDIFENDPFGYVEQLAGYQAAMGSGRAGWLAIDKQLGHITYLDATEYTSGYDVQGRIRSISSTLDGPLPERCYEPETLGQSGNLVLGTNCSYCPHKHPCWSDANGGVGLRTFLYSSGPKYLVQVNKEPAVSEVTF